MPMKWLLPNWRLPTFISQGLNEHVCVTVLYSMLLQFGDGRKEKVTFDRKEPPWLHIFIVDQTQLLAYELCLLVPIALALQSQFQFVCWRRKIVAQSTAWLWILLFILLHKRIRVRWWSANCVQNRNKRIMLLTKLQLFARVCTQSMLRLS